MKSVRLCRTFFLCTLTCTLTFAAPCTAGTGSGAEPLPAGAEAYVPILENLQDIVARGLGGRDRRDGERGVMEAVSGSEGPDALRSVGRLVRDFSGDGIPELLVGAVSQDADGKFLGSDIYALYTLKDGKPHLTLEGTLRNAFALMGNGQFFHTGSGGGMRRVFGVYSLTPDGTALVCRDFWFTHEKDGTWEPGFYHNTSGKMDITCSEEVSETVFTERTERMEQERRIAEFTPLSQPVLAGKQASLPAGNGEASVLSRFGFGNILMGGWSEQQGWLNARELQNSPRFHKFRIWGGETCRVLGMYGLVEGNAVISAVHSDHPDEYPSVRTPSFDVHAPAGVISPPSAVLTLLCDWEAQPRKPESVLMKTNAPYERHVKDYLASRGLHTQEVRIVQTCRIDLEGDGVDEVLVCAQNMVGHVDWKPDGLLAVPDHAHKGMYSILLLRKIVDGKVVQLPLHEHIVSTAQAAERPPVLGRLYLFADLNGDGVMEIIAGTVSPTESVHRIFEVKGGNIREVLSGRAHG